MWMVLTNILFSKNALRIGALILLACLLFFSYSFYQKYQDMKSENKAYKSRLERKVKDQSFTDSKGRSHYKTVPTIANSLEVRKEIRKDSNVKLIQESVPAIKKNLNNLINGNVMTTVTTINNELELRDSIIQLNDSIKVLCQKFSNITPWVEQHGEIVDGKLKQQLRIYDTIVVVAYWHRKWFLGKKSIEGEAVSMNPDCKIHIKEFLIKKLEGD